MQIELTSIQANICKLVSASLFRQPTTFAPETDWDEIREELRLQTVNGLLLYTLPDLPLSGEFRKSWRDECLQVMNNGIRVRFMQAGLLAILEREEIPCLILKGTAAAMNYPDPLLRDMGDVDLYIPVRFHEIVKDLMLANGYIQVQNEKDHGRHIAFKKDDVTFEIHRKFALINGSEEKKYLDELLEECCGADSSKRMSVTQAGKTFYAPSVNVNGLVLLEHIGQHIFAGLGLRQIIDWMMFVNASLHDTEWSVFQKMAQKSGLEMLAKTATKMCIRYFGLTGDYAWCMDADNAAVDELLTYLFDCGNFGNKMRNSGQISSIQNRLHNSKNVFVVLQESGEHNWKLFKRHRWLRPFAWCYQIFRYARQVLTSPDKLRTISKGTAEGNRRANLMKSLGIYEKS